VASLRSRGRFGHPRKVRETTGNHNGVEMLVPVFQRLLADTGLSRREVGFGAGSFDYLAGAAFSFVTAVDAIGALPPIAESTWRATRPGRCTRPG